LACRKLKILQSILQQSQFSCPKSDRKCIKLLRKAQFMHIIDKNTLPDSVEIAKTLNKSCALKCTKTDIMGTSLFKCSTTEAAAKS